MKIWALRKRPPSFTDTCARIRAIQMLSEVAIERYNHECIRTTASVQFRSVVRTWSDHMCWMKSDTYTYDSHSTCRAIQNTWVVSKERLNIVLLVYARTALPIHYSDGATEICEHFDFTRYAFSFTVFYTLKFIRRNTYACVEYIIPRLSTPTLSEIRVYRSCFHFSKWRNKKPLHHIIFS